MTTPMQMLRSRIQEVTGFTLNLKAQWPLVLERLKCMLILNSITDAFKCTRESLNLYMIR